MRGLRLILVLLVLLGGSFPILLQSGPALLITHGPASGDVTATEAVIWARANGAATMEVEFGTDPQLTEAQAAEPLPVDEGTDFTGKVFLKRLEPGTRYYYRVRFSQAGVASEPLQGSFTTAPAPEEPGNVTFIWSADLGGQNFCRQPEYSIFRTMSGFGADFFLFLGDTIYADESCPSPPNEPGSAFAATTLEGYRAKHRYNLADPPVREFFQERPVYAIWDDHEVTDNFSGPFEPLMPLGRRAFLEYYPIAPDPEDPTRLYRSFRWGRELELFILDTRQYRSRNTDPDGPQKTMLGREQLEWLKQGLQGSDATWKIIISTVPLSVPSRGQAQDSWANGRSRTGFERELLEIVDFILTDEIRNVVWLTGDVHFPQAISYDPDRDGTPDFYEFTSGPLSALPGTPRPWDRTLNPQSLYIDSGFFN
ncbi:MAG: alkaline phosphatase D family protein, partial [Candidatus Bipolaricaulia bacterium]